MSKKNKRKIGAFWKVLIIFAEVFLIATVIGLLFFWDFIEAYEASRPQNAIVAFMNELTPEKISGKDTKTLAAIDPHIRSEAQNRAEHRGAHGVYGPQRWQNRGPGGYDGGTHR